MEFGKQAVWTDERVTPNCYVQGAVDVGAIVGETRVGRCGVRAPRVTLIGAGGCEHSSWTEIGVEAGFSVDAESRTLRQEKGRVRREIHGRRGHEGLARDGVDPAAPESCEAGWSWPPRSAK